MSARQARRRGGASRSSRSRSGCRPSRRPGASTRSSSRAWRTPPASTSSRRARTRAATPWSASAAPARRTPPTSPAASASRELIIPPASGAASALGFLAAPLSFEQVALPARARLDEAGFDAAALNAVLDELEADGRALLAEAGVADADVDGRALRRHAPRRPDARDRGSAARRADRRVEPAGDPRRLRRGLHRALHLALRGRASSRPISFRVRCVGPAPELPLARGRRAARPGRQRKGTRRAYFGDAASSRPPSTTATRSRPATAIDGPAIIEEREATTVVPPGDAVTVDEVGNLRIAIAGAAAREAVDHRATCRSRPRCARIEADPIALEIMWSRLVNVVEEMWLHGRAAPRSR